MTQHVRALRLAGGGVRMVGARSQIDYGRHHVQWTIVQDRLLGLVLPHGRKPIPDPFGEGPLSDEELRRVREGTFPDW